MLDSFFLPQSWKVLFVNIRFPPIVDSVSLSRILAAFWWLLTLSDFYAKVSDLFAKVAEVCAKVSEVCAKVSDLYAEVSDLYAKVSDLCEKDSDLYAKRSDLYEKVSDLCAKCSDLCERASDLYADFQLRNYREYLGVLINLCLFLFYSYIIYLTHWSNGTRMA